MKMKQEVDAMITMGVDPFEALVLLEVRWRSFAHHAAAAVFVATLAGLAGGERWYWPGRRSNISPEFFAQRLIDYVGVRRSISGSR